MRCNRFSLVLAIAAVTLLALAASANAAIVIDSQTTIDGPGGAWYDPVNFGSYDASGADKLVVLVGGGRDRGSSLGIDGVTYGGTPLTEAVKVGSTVTSPQGVAAGIYYLDSPGAAGDLVVDYAGAVWGIRNAITVLELSGAAPGHGPVASSPDLPIVSLTTAASDSLVLAISKAVPDSATETPLPPLTDLNASRHGAGYQFVASPSAVMPTFTLGDATAAAAFEPAGGGGPGQTTTITGSADGPNGSHDTWNNAANWDNGIPSGAVDAVVGVGVTAQVWNPATPAYTGSLTLEGNSTLQLGWTTNYPENLNALGGSGVTFNDGSELRLRLPFTVDLPEITLAGDASIHLSPSTSAHHQARNFDNPIIGTGALTVTGNNNNTMNLDLANPGWSGDFVANADDGWRVDANASGAFGTGDVTFNARTAGDRGATLIIDAPDVIADTATLFLNGPRDQRQASKLILNADDTVAGFWLDGVQMAAGDYTSLSGLTDILGNPLISGSGILTVTGGVGPPPETPVTILSTDFTGRTVSGATASNIPWVTNGVADPGDLTAVAVGGGTFGGLFDTANAQDHFAPDRNTGNEGPWSVDIPIDLTVPEVVIEDIVLDWQHFNNSGNFQGANRSVDWTATVTGSLSGEIGTETALNISGTSGAVTITFATPLTLTDTETWTLQILAEGSNTTGNNTGLDAINVLGQVGAAAVPEPSTLVLAALGLLGLAFYARRRRRLP